MKLMLAAPSPPVLWPYLAWRIKLKILIKEKKAQKSRATMENVFFHFPKGLWLLSCLNPLWPHHAMAAFRYCHLTDSVGTLDWTVWLFYWSFTVTCKINPDWSCPKTWKYWLIFFIILFKIHTHIHTLFNIYVIYTHMYCLIYCMI